MCGRYLIEQDDEFTQILYTASDGDTGGDEPYGEVFPSCIVPVLTGTSVARFMRWGFPAPFDRNPFINARSETAGVVRTFADAYNNRRCLVPATAYYEWKLLSGKRREKYEFALPGRGLMYFAGIYSETNEFAILTRDAAPELCAIHERMPVIIPRESREYWLSGGTDALSRAETRLDFRAV
jgi:putative SOS response-associated peptidase YedK